MDARCGSKYCHLYSRWPSFGYWLIILLMVVDYPFLISNDHCEKNFFNETILFSLETEIIFYQQQFFQVNTSFSSQQNSFFELISCKHIMIFWWLKCLDVYMNTNARGRILKCFLAKIIIIWLIFCAIPLPVPFFVIFLKSKMSTALNP